MSALRSCTAPPASGYCTMAPKTGPSNVICSIGTTRRSMPSGSALERRTSMVCGKQPSLTRQTRVRGTAPIARASAMHQRHSFGRSGRLVEQRGARHLHPRQIHHHGLEIQKRLQPALRDFGLVRRVRCIPARVLHHHPQDHAWREGVVVAEADVGPEDLVSVRQVSEAVEVLLLAFGGRQRERRLEPDRGRDRLVHQRVERWRADRPEHLVALVRRRPDVAARKPVAGVE